MMKKTLTFLFLGLVLISYSQNEGAFFYFNNNGGIYFDQCTGNETPLFDGQTSSANLDSNNSSISDKFGNLLFYSDGLTVFGNDHVALPNGGGLSGNGNSLILPKPGNENLYYIFTVDLSSTSSNGMEYSVIDRTLNNQNGDIIASQKRIPLVTYNSNDNEESTYKCSSKLTAVKSDDCSYYWIITHFLDRFYAFKLDENGVNSNPVVSSLIPEVPMSFYAFGNSVPPIADLKVSPMGNKLAMTYSNAESTVITDSSPKGLYIYDLNPNTGVVSNPINLTIPPELIGFDLVDYFAISVEFSRDGKYLFATTERDSDSGYERNPRIWRWNTSVPSMNATSELVYETDEYIGGGSIQLAPNGKIYHVRELLNLIEATNFNYTLGIIENPSAIIEDLVYEEFGLALNIGDDTSVIASNTLPQYNPQWFSQLITITDNTLDKCKAFICGASSAMLTAPDDNDAIYKWYKDDVLITNSVTSSLEVTVEGDYRVEVSFNSSDCSYVGYAEVIESSDAPEVTDATAYQCDGNDNDGLASFRLNKYIDLFVLDSREVDVRFYETLEEAQENINELDQNGFRNRINPQTIYAAVSNVNDGCFSIAALELVVSPSDGGQEIVLKNCDSEGEFDGFSSFDLDSTIPQILDNFNNDYRVTFHETLESAQIDELELVSPYSNIIAFNQVVYARVDSGGNCEGIIEVELLIEGPPDIPLDVELIYCQDIFPNTIELNTGLSTTQISDFQYQWNTGATSPTISVNAPGEYSVQIFNGTDCPIERTITVVPSSNPIIEDIIVNDLGTDNSIEVIVSGDGEYEYSIDGNAAFTENAVFNNLPVGIYNVRIRDKNGCGFSEELVSVSGFPKYFSPNGDGVNDTWKVKNLSSRINFTGTIYIYDRYGKLVHIVLPNSGGWDGTYEGSRMPQSDYWFKAVLNNGETLRGHFALRR